MPYIIFCPAKMVLNFPSQGTATELKRCLYYFPEKGVLSVHIASEKTRSPKAVLLKFSSREHAEDIAQLASETYKEDLEVEEVN